MWRFVDFRELIFEYFDNESSVLMKGKCWIKLVLKMFLKVDYRDIKLLSKKLNMEICYVIDF